MDVLLYALPSSQIKDLDVLLATLMNIKVVELQDERHMDREGELIIYNCFMSQRRIKS